jgi:hypothetical protein
MYHSFGIIVILPGSRLATGICSYSSVKYFPQDIAGKQHRFLRVLTVRVFAGTGVFRQDFSTESIFCLFADKVLVKISAHNTIEG